MTENTPHTGETNRPLSLTGIAIALAASVAIAMVFSRGIAPIVLVVVATLLVTASLRAGAFSSMLSTAKSWLSKPSLWIVGLSFLYLSASLLWSPAPERGLTFLMHLAGTTLLTILALLALNQQPSVSAHLPKLLSLCLLIAAVLTLAELLAGSPLRAMIPGASTEPYRLNRAAVALVLLAPLTVSLITAEQRLWQAALITLMVVWAAFASVSQSAQLAVVVAVTVFLAARMAPTLVRWLVLAGGLSSLVLAPLLVTSINQLIPQAIHDAVGYGTLGVRGDIWTAYAELISQKLWFGHGLEASNITAQTFAQTVPDTALRFLDFGHPHNVAIQIWFELGLIGVFLACGLMVAAWRAIALLGHNLQAAGTTVFATVWAVALVSHGAWQAWWWCLVALTVLLLVAANSRHRRCI